MNEDHARRALTRCLFVLVSPAPVVGEGLAFEELEIIGRRLVHQHQQRLAANVNALIVVPAVLRSLDPISHVNDVRIHLRLRLLGLVITNVLVEELQTHCSA